MDSAHTHFVQLSCLQALKARVIEVDKTRDEAGQLSNPTILNEVIAIFAWLLKLYLLDSAKPLRKTLVSVIGVVHDSASTKSVFLHGNTDQLNSCLHELAKEYFEKIMTVCQGGGGGGGRNMSQKDLTITATNLTISTLVGVFELPLLHQTLLCSSNERIEPLLECLNVHLSVHLMSVPGLSQPRYYCFSSLSPLFPLFSMS
jgi:hypothetical protein